MFCFDHEIPADGWYPVPALPANHMSLMFWLVTHCPGTRPVNTFNIDVINVFSNPVPLASLVVIELELPEPIKVLHWVFLVTPVGHERVAPHASLAEPTPVHLFDHEVDVAVHESGQVC